jgi:hypothetical protein
MGSLDLQKLAISWYQIFSRGEVFVQRHAVVRLRQ